MFAGLRRLWLALGLITSKAEQEKVDDKGIYPEIIFFVKLSEIFFLLLLLGPRGPLIEPLSVRPPVRLQQFFLSS